MTYFILGVLIAAIVFYFLKKSFKENEQERHEALPQAENNQYEGLRDMALNTTPEQQQLSVSRDQTKVYGIIMDWALGNGIATLTSFSTGDASLYYSSGGGMIAAG